MAEEIKPIIKVDTGESQKTVKSLKKEISDLKDHILNLTKGTDEYNEAVTDLQSKQRELDEVMALTKKTATALDGSYDALTHRMSLLKKEWRATADEARRAEIGQEIAEINAQLKEMDASVGNFQRNVGNYVSHWEGMPDVVDEFGDAVAAASAAPKDFGTAMREMNESIEPTKQGFESVGNIASGLASGFAAVQGAMALCGIESENFEKTMIKIQAAMALAQGVSGLKGLIEGFSKLKVLLGGITGGGMVAAVAAVATGVALLIKKLIDWRIETLATNTAVDDYKISVEQLTEANNTLANSVGKPISEFKLLKSEYETLTTNKEKELWVKENASAFEELGLKIGDVNAADKVFIEQSDDVIAAMMKRAKADAVKEMYAKAEADIVRAQIQAITDVENLPQSFYSNSDSTVPDEYAKYAGFYKYQGQGKYATREDWSGGGFYNKVNGVYAGEDADGNPIQTQAFKDYVESETKELRAVSALWMQAVKDAEKEYNKAVEDLNGIITGGDGNGNGNGNGGDGKKTPEQIRDELVAAGWDYINRVTDEQIAALDDDITIEEEKPKKPLYEYKDGDAEKRANIRIGQEERIANRLIELNNMTEQSEEERAAKEFQIRQDLEKKKLDLLKQFYEQAKSEGDTKGMLALEQEIADQELAIDKAKYEEKLRLEEEYRQKKEKITNQINQSITAAAQVTQGILEITQAAYEKDEEISEKEAKRIKGMQIAIATMNMLAGITAALSGAFTTKSGPWDIAMAAVQAATIAASGTANIMKIKNTDLTGNVPSGAMGAVTPSSNIFGTDIPFSYVRNVTSASETDALNQDNRVYILESDIQASNKKVSVRESESSF